ncbi:hypothetical protein [Paenibacillus cremeus]|uniref:Uncharacterized protein n=1 Tax=Paenibacillus cremeus TaxID=2163881 RepID=A0A559KAC5_9BACL|nr:hypothetical protein [Paenibacillus cremeus]TVY09090.1 hypothetical protein FPZ49_15380 [Paenibacillus cremeus]
MQNYKFLINDPNFYKMHIHLGYPKSYTFWFLQIQGEFRFQACITVPDNATGDLKCNLLSGSKTLMDAPIWFRKLYEQAEDVVSKKFRLQKLFS